MMNEIRKDFYDWRKQRDKYHRWKLKNELRALWHAWFYILIILGFGFLGGLGYAAL